MSSHSNPHGIAFNLAARRCGVPTVLITHGMPVRPHPKNLFAEFDAWLALLNDSRVRRSFSESVFRDLDESDVVLGGNSSVLIEAVVAGRPGVYVTGLDCGSPDFHKFVASGLIYAIDAELNFDFDEMLCFYQRPEWLSILRFFANIDEDESIVAKRITTAIGQLVF
jgi:hypothetical protein